MKLATLTDHAYLRRAYRNAQHSPDPSTQNGAVLYDAGFRKVLGEGCNALPRRVQVTDERLVRPLKYEVIEHAERNAIYDAALRGNGTLSATLYCPWAACADCARGIIQAGITRLVRHHDATVHGAGGNWDESISIADVMMHEAGVEIVDIEGKLMPVDFAIRHAGELWSP